MRMLFWWKLRNRFYTRPIYSIKDGVKISEIGKLIEAEARKGRLPNSFKNLAGHGVAGAA